MHPTRSLPALALAAALLTAAPAVAAPAAATLVAAAAAETPEQLYDRAEKLLEATKEAQAIPLYRRAAERGHGLSKLKLALLLGDSSNKAYNRAEAIKWARSAWKEPAGDEYVAKQGAVNLSELLRRNGTLAEVQEGLAIHEALGPTDPYSYYTLGLIYDAGEGEVLPADHEKATTYFRKAAEAGDNSAIIAMAERLLSGSGCAVDAPQAVEWYKKAAAKDHWAAMEGLVKVYRTGHPGVPKDPYAALGWNRKLVGLNLDFGLQTMGELYEEGVGVSVDLVQARSWYLKAWKKEPYSQPVRLARLYEKGLGGPVDLVAAYAYYRQCEYDDEAKAAANRLYARFDKATKKRADAMAKKVEAKQ